MLSTNSSIDILFFLANPFIHLLYSSIVKSLLKILKITCFPHVAINFDCFCNG